jgi:uncharacterized protein
MGLQEDRPEGILAVRWVTAEKIAVEAREFDRSFLLAPETALDWAPTGLQDLDDAALAAILALEPQVVILGTGQVQRFLPPRQQAFLLARGVGIECMDNAAAARTFNLLAQEGRRVIGAFLLPG